MMSRKLITWGKDTKIFTWGKSERVFYHGFSRDGSWDEVAFDLGSVVTLDDEELSLFLRSSLSSLMISIWMVKWENWKHNQIKYVEIKQSIT